MDLKNRAFGPVFQVKSTINYSKIDPPELQTVDNGGDGPMVIRRSGIPPRFEHGGGACVIRNSLYAEPFFVQAVEGVGYLVSE